MVHFLVAALFLFSSIAQAAVVPSGVPSIDVGNLHIASESTYSSSNTSGWFMLTGSGSPGASNFNPLYRNGDAYQVPAGFTTKCVSLEWGANGAGATMQLVADASAAITVGDTALTAGVFESGTSGIAAHANNTSNVYVAEPLIYNFDSEDYVGWQQITAATNFYIRIVCKEIAN